MASTSPTPLRILLVDDHFVVRSGLAASLGLEDDLRVVAEAGDANEALAQYATKTPDVVIMDLQLGNSSGLDATSRLCKEHPTARVLVFSSFARDEDVYRAIRAGAMGYLQKAAPREDLLQAVRTVAQGKRFLPPDIAQRLAERLGRPEPSARELEVLALIAKGRSNKEIAAALGVSDETVKTHVSNIMQKLQAQDRAHAVTEAIRLGLLEV
ncbi:LuxR family two component transcriptional regulator [Roseimicrobium gellanilyticum]|uniref:LuxR family two component transcriptional regulator n=1 Tax=Roseimicrobium gellanilyticum TaxID=748857 RepID=A0A366HU39_9BACT|nr:response regulator transcription factor [Roseimicrobium gellanilyticum]RBP46217.1 LuxR family two component transcriptional regulator [Roseimicrobium gellanilyticum]